MTSSLISWAAAGGEAGGEHGQELPMPPIGYGLVALLLFLALLAVLWSFRNTAPRTGPRDSDKKSRH